ncbi:hypothetical protein [Blastopirellula marina]|uniref:Uncharacterized protein n=1 Tax=Blastopirellula marina TaxID=124 RepID=A0A2S8G2V3_9BACT|nr:hypothetical protein [Blastopirellula marina]PQO38591.1 hypothetical protein C5Y98_11125 [Blastopirellula marina]PTL45248.1 hypothetical protein C5Y97_11135 [Blastopirellula marina]
MIVSPHGGFLVDTETIAFARMYRCHHCANVVQGIHQDDSSVICEKCESELHSDDEIAYRLDSEK